MPDEWPIAAAAADHPVDPAKPAGRDRLPIVRRDLFLDERARLTEQERALISAMLVGLVDQLADEIRRCLPPHVQAHAEADRGNLLGRLWADGALDRPGLVALLLRRATEQLIAATCRGSAEAGSTVDRLVGHEDSAVAGAAMALAVARGRRRDRFGRLTIEYDDVDSDDALALAHHIAAAMRAAIPGASVGSDRELAAAAVEIAARHDPRRRIDGSAVDLATALDAAGSADDSLIAALAGEGDAALLVALCAVRAGIASDTAWTLLVTGADSAMTLARLARVDRATAAAMVAALGEPLMWGDPGEAIERFDALDDDAVDAVRGWWQLPSAYRAARTVTGGRYGDSID